MSVLPVEKRGPGVAELAERIEESLLFLEIKQTYCTVSGE